MVICGKTVGNRMSRLYTDLKHWKKSVIVLFLTESEIDDILLGKG